MRLLIDIPEKIEEYIKDYIPIGAGNNVFCYPDEIVRTIQNGTPIPDNTNILTVTEWVDRCRECGKNYVKIPDNASIQVELEGDGYADGEFVYDYGKCPKCGWEFEEGDKDWEEPYCCHCGQRLNWFYEEGEANESRN